MEVVFDPDKNDRNIQQRKLPFEQAAILDWSTAHIRRDDRKDYGECRYIALAFLEGRLHVLVFTETARGIRVISFRRANGRERRKYDEEA
jgi:hypothetical protein